MAKYITFDCYGTLLNEAATYDEVAQLAKAIGVDGAQARQAFIEYQDDRANVIPYLDYDLLTRNNLQHLDELFGLTHQFERYFPEVLLAHRQLVPFPEVLATLTTLHERGYHLIMMSNSSWDIIPFNAAVLKVPFDIWTAEDVKAYKPDLAFFNAVAAAYPFTATNHIHIAQGYTSDIMATDQLGWRSVWVNRDHQHSGAVRPTYEVHQLDEVLPLLP
ncbi:HAD family hydrolase [Furfurilactobacillus siliginis]|uniref:HAD superfamily hydrolase n=1 Tax=Furfurilactobacillus siliginis TaxID=348151 RepID=A0A0R2LF60_9LACO|nr:HAD family hydrolase [Furfurilactobacillus siliginis]KRN97197.1 HAD superfamily hydrolase [Furfurilactobacillus siliginis]GEK28659.1 phosphohydrolase [Furfurilactobacillus siliginis]